MDRQRLLVWYHNYALVLGVTSYRLVGGRFRQTRLTRLHCLLMNCFQLLTLPMVFKTTARYLLSVSWWPNFIASTIYILCGVAYAAVVYTVICRSSRDDVLQDVERVVARIERHAAGQTEPLGRYLSYLFYVKLGTVLYHCLAGLAMGLMLPRESRWKAFVGSFLYGNAINIPVLASYRYFQVLFSLTRCFQYLNRRLNQFARGIESCQPSRMELEQLHRLWTLHALLGKCILRMNRIFGWMMLAARFNNFTSSVINWYWGLLFYFGIDSPIHLLAFGTLNFWISLIDFYLVDLICDLTIEQQNAPQHDISEGRWFKELNAYLLYAGSSRLSIWVCGLYKANKECWFRMLGAIVGYTTVLLQFHLILRDKYSL